jgi:pyruvate/2-oxoglutarate dehydrogenase complex dihydrolipoamide dehydrogenase (E3) component
MHLHFICSVNPLIARESRVGFADTIGKAPYPKRVLIIGGGPAGLQAALTASQRGHDITLVERGARLGGMLNFTDRDEIKKDLRDYKEYLVNRVQKTNVRILLDQEADETLLASFRPDVILIAVGAKPVVPDFISGFERARHASDVYFNPQAVRGESFVIVGGGLVGDETGLHLRTPGKTVTVFEAMDDYAKDANRIHRKALDIVIPDISLDIVTGARVSEITADGVVYEKDNILLRAAGDTVLYAVGMRSEHGPYLAMHDKAETVLEIGDCRKVGKLDGAVHSAFFAAMDIGTLF